MLYLENPPQYEALEKDLAWEKTYAAEAEKRRERNPALYKVSRLPKAAWQRAFKRDKLASWARRYFEPGPVLDVGCSDGHTLERLPAQFSPHGVEISLELSRIAGERFAKRGGYVIQADALSGVARFKPDYFTGVIMTAFLEHEADPGGLLKAAAGVMRPGARLIVKVPNYGCWNRPVRGARWCGFRFPDHVNYFTPALLIRLLTASGFRPLHFGILDHFPTSDNMWLVAEKAG
jgi:SAM-dependent methyltransferase